MTSRVPSQPAKAWISSSTIPSARRASACARGGLRRTCACRPVDVDQRDAGQQAALRVDVARHGEVQQQQRPPRARRHDHGQLLGADDRVRRGGGGDDDVGPLELAGQRVEGDRLAAEAPCERDRAVAPAVGDEHRRHAALGQRARGQLGGLARADDAARGGARELAERARAASTATEATLAPPAPIAVSVRTRLPVASAARKSLLVSGPVVRAASAAS
jgi:hypothetical protein